MVELLVNEVMGSPKPENAHATHGRMERSSGGALYGDPAMCPWEGGVRGRAYRVCSHGRIPSAAWIRAAGRYRGQSAEI